MPAFTISRKNRLVFSGPIHDALAGILVDMAKKHLIAQSISAMTDNSTGTAVAANASLPTLTLPAPYTVTGTDASPKAGFDADMDKFDDACLAIGKYVNGMRTFLGLPNLTLHANPAVAGTIAAVDKALTAVDGSSNTAVEAVSAIALLTKLRDNLYNIALSLSDVRASVGLNRLIIPPTYTFSTTIADITAATAAGVTGTNLSTLADTAVDAFLLAAANTVATLAARASEAAVPSASSPLSAVYIG